MEFNLHRRQMDALTSTATEIMYGGAAGGGKSFFMRMAALAFAYDIPGLQVYLFRRAFPDLEKNHVYGESGLLATMQPWIEKGWAKYNGTKHIIELKNGSNIFLCHLNSRADLINYQGAEIHLLLIDEGTQFEDDEYRYLRARVRLGGMAAKIPEQWRGRFPRIYMSANPGGVGHMWVKAGFIDGALPMEIRKMPPEEGGMMRQYIPALMADNPTLDADYGDKLSGLGSPEMVKAWREGNWDVVAGTALEMLSRGVHGVRRFPIPEHWTRIMGMDWGTAKPFSIGWYAVVEGDTLIKGKAGAEDKYLPDGALVKYREYYGWNGKPDVGCRKDAATVARELIGMEEGERIDYRVADSAMWAQTDGPSPQENMYTGSGRKVVLRQATKERMVNYQEVRARLNGSEGRPMLYFMEDMKHTWRTLPGLQLDDINPEKGPDSTMEDHVYDEVSYTVRSRPFITTAETRAERAFKRHMKEARKVTKMVPR